MADPIDDFSASIATTGQLQLNMPTSGNFEVYRDEDWFRFHADAGQHYLFSSSLDQSYWPPTLAIYDASGKLVSDASGVNFEPLQSGDYYLSATGLLPASYSVTWQVRQDDYSANNSAPGWLSPGAQLNGFFEYKQDSDRFQFSAVAGQLYRFDTTLLNDAIHQLGVVVTDEAGNALDVSVSNSVNGANGVMSCWVLAKTTGTYAINMSPGWYASGEHYTITEGAVTSDDYGGTLASATPLTMGVATAGKLQWPTDVDYFSVQLTAGTTYTVSSQLTADNPDASLSVQFQGPGGSYLPSVGGARTFSYTPTVSGTYYVDVNASYSAQLPGYTVTVSQTPDDYGATIATAGKLVVDGPGTQGHLESGGGDRDWFTVSLDAGQSYWVQLASPPAGFSSAAGYATMNILDASGKLLASTQNMNFSDGNRILPFVPSAKGSYIVEVGGNYGDQGNYQVIVKHGPVDDVGNDPAHAAPLALDANVNGKLELATDKDVYKLHVDAGNVYRISAQGIGGDAGWSNAIVLDGQSSNSSGWLDQLPNGYSRHDNLYKATATGDLYITVTQSANYNAVQTGSYTLHASSYGQDDFPQVGQGLSTLAVGGKIQGVINYPGDVDSFTVHLEAGRTYVFDLQGALSGVGTLDATTATLNLYGASSQQGVSATALPGGEARLSCVVSATGDYQISVKGDASHLGSYTIGAVQTSGDVTAPALATPTDVDIPGWSGQFALQFSESVMHGSGSFVLKDSSGNVFAPHGQNSYKITAASNQIFIDTGGYLAPGETYTLSVAPDSVADLAGNHLNGAASVRFHTAPVASQGTVGNDLLVGHLNGARIDGGDGLDTVYYAHSWYLFDIKRNAATNEITVQQLGTQSGDVLTGIERIMLQDQAIALDIDGAAGQAYRLYKAAFDRAPDYAGLGFWINAMDHGMSLQTVAHGFAMSPEFLAKYGAAPTDAQYINQLYHNVLHRDGDAGGTSFWLDALQHGLSRDQVLTFFSESPENQAAVIGQIQNGIGYTPYG